MCIRDRFRRECDLPIDRAHLMIVSPDEGAIDRNIFYSSVLGIDMGLFYKRRDYTTVVDGRNPIIAHEYLGCLLYTSWEALETAIEIQFERAVIVPCLSPFVTDGRFYAQPGGRVYRFSPFSQMPISASGAFLGRYVRNASMVAYPPWSSTKQGDRLQRADTVTSFPLCTIRTACCSTPFSIPPSFDGIRL